jgi:alpha-ribazole phosphatase
MSVAMDGLHVVPDPMVLHAWRHPKPQGAPGRCIGQTDLPVDRRKAKRLAHRIRRAARRHRWPYVVHTSSLQRCAKVGQQLKRWGWRHHVHADLNEMNFGTWDGLPWSVIAQAEIEAWCADFLLGAPGQGESLHRFFSRIERWSGLHVAASSSEAPCLVVAHAGCMQVWQWLSTRQAWPTDAAQWPRPPAYGARKSWPANTPASSPADARLNTAP